MEATALQFTTAAKVLASACRRLGLVAPGYRSPPRQPGVDRTIRRSMDGGGGAVVAVRVRRRPWPAVVADMIDGAVVANGLTPVQADVLRRSLWDAVTTADLLPGPVVEAVPVATPHAGRVARRGSLHLASDPAAA